MPCSKRIVIGMAMGQIMMLVPSRNAIGESRVRTFTFSHMVFTEESFDYNLKFACNVEEVIQATHAAMVGNLN